MNKVTESFSLGSEKGFTLVRNQRIYSEVVEPDPDPAVNHEYLRFQLDFRGNPASGTSKSLSLYLYDNPLDFRLVQLDNETLEEVRTIVFSDYKPLEEMVIIEGPDYDVSYHVSEDGFGNPTYGDFYILNLTLEKSTFELRSEHSSVELIYSYDKTLIEPVFPSTIPLLEVLTFSKSIPHCRFDVRGAELIVPRTIPEVITSMFAMFKYCTHFNSDISGWDTNNVTDMEGVFEDCHLFNQPIGNWNVSNVEDMNEMFRGAILFDQPLNSWDVSNVTDMEYMFREASTFNRPLDNWNVSNVTDMDGIFREALCFNQDLSQWCVPLISRAPSRFDRDAASWVLPKPIWGTCPHVQAIV